MFKYFVEIKNSIDERSKNRYEEKRRKMKEDAKMQISFQREFDKLFLKEA